MRSALYRGHVSHTRRVPRTHSFRIAAHFVFLDLDELSRVFRGRWLWSIERRNVASFRRADFLGDPARPLREAVLDRVEEKLGRRPAGHMGLFAQLRTFGYAFNPVSFYFCHDDQGRLDAIVAEITNTPWRERHAYVLDTREATEDTGAAGGDGGQFTFRFAKEFHVSPFFDLDQEYEWRFSAPGERFEISMTNFERGRAVFHAGLSCERAPITGWSLAAALVRYPLQPLRLHCAIYWQAVRLWLKRTPFFTHPSHRLGAQDAPLA